MYKTSEFVASSFSVIYCYDLYVFPLSIHSVLAMYIMCARSYMCVYAIRICS